ncbi:hypothetical protein SSPNP10_32150 [Streptomyces sp. NP10]|nr:hypothetical protein SSPNP10_32150 [Streptomyces sp. NP10]
MTAWTRSLAPVFARMRVTCVFTVDSARWRRAAISVLDQPCPITVRISRSRSVRAMMRGSEMARAPGTTGRWWTYASRSRRVSVGATTASPTATARMPARSSSGRASLTRKPLAPARRPSYAYSSRSNVVTIRMRVRAPDAMMRRVASMPSRPGMRMSISTTSGWWRATRWTASVPLPASPTTVMSSWLSSSMRNPKRCIGWSSAISTVVTGACPPGEGGAVPAIRCVPVSGPLRECRRTGQRVPSCP